MLAFKDGGLFVLGVRTQYVSIPHTNARGVIASQTKGSARRVRLSSAALRLIEVSSKPSHGLVPGVLLNVISDRKSKN